MLTVMQLSDRFQLKPAFVYACLRDIALLQPFIHTAEKNAKLLDESGLPIFERIAELKRQGFPLAEIRTQIDGKQDETPAKTDSFQANEPTTNEKAGVEMAWFRHYTAELEKVNERLAEQQAQARQEIGEREILIRDLIERNASLTATLRMLPAPEHYASAEQQRHEQQRAAAAILGELKACRGFWQWKRRKELLAALEKLLKSV